MAGAGAEGRPVAMVQTRTKVGPSLAPLAGLERLCQVCNGPVVALVTRPVHVRALRAMLTTTRLMKILICRHFEECRVSVPSVTRWSRSAMNHLVCRVYVGLICRLPSVQMTFLPGKQTSCCITRMGIKS